MHPLHKRDDRGSMLIVALGILTLLTALALTFVSLMDLERKASKNYVDGVKARLIAEGGLEQTAAEIKHRLSGEAWSDPGADWIYANGDYSLPLELASAVRPGDPDDSPAIDAIRASYAGSLGRSYDGGDDRYKVKVIDTQTQFNLNSEYELVDGVDRVYVRFLDTLGVAISENPRNRSGSGAGRNPVLHARYPKNSQNPWTGGEAIWRFRQTREGSQFNSKTELLEVLASETDYELLQDFVTTRSWFDPHTVTATSVESLHRKPWTELKDLSAPGSRPRSPINVNLATTEILAANLAGIAGRGIFVYTGDFDTRDARMQAIDQGTSFEYASYKEEKEYRTDGVLVYLEPFGFQPGAQAEDPPFVHGAIECAKLIKARVEQQGPFRSFAEWETWVDQNLTDNFLRSTRDPRNGSRPCFPQPSTARILALDESPLSSTPTDAEVRRHPRFEPWFWSAVRSMIKANMNPNPRLSGWNPNPAAYLPVDKGALLYFHDPANPGSTKEQRQTNEWCLGSRGIFEITALGEVLGAPQTATGTGTATPDQVIYAQAKVRAVVQLWDQVTHTTQREFERKGTSYQADRDSILSYPVPRIYWDPTAEVTNVNELATLREEGRGKFLSPDTSDGQLQLSTRHHRTIAGTELHTRVVELGSANPPEFELLLQDRRVLNPASGDLTSADSLMADTSGGIRHHPLGQPAQGQIGNGWGWPFPWDPPPALAPAAGMVPAATSGIAPHMRPAGELQKTWRYDVLTNDGYLNTDLRKTSLWFRANDKNSANAPADPERAGKLRGESQPDLTSGNVAPTTRGGCEFWYKPEFDWAVRSGPNDQILNRGGTEVPDQRFCGLLGISHVLPGKETFQGGPAPNPPGSWTRGTQMYVTRNTSGELRVTRLYYEVVGPKGDPQEEPLVTDPKAGGKITIGDYWDKATREIEYPWPPVELLTIPAPFNQIKFARTDHWFSFQQLKHWRAHEWHHIGIHWDDAAGEVRVWLDGLPVTAAGSHKTGPRYTPMAVNPAGQNPPHVPANQVNPAWPSELPAFVRLNSLTGPTAPPGGGDQANYEESVWPKDQIQIGGLRRDQARKAGLFKHDEDPILPANGTIDDVRFYDGSSSPAGGANITAERYEEVGLWRGEFDLSGAFPQGISTLTLSSLNFTAYLPTYFGNARKPDGAGIVTVRFAVLDQAGNVKYADPAWEAKVESNLTGQPAFKIDLGGSVVRVERTDRLVYDVELESAKLQGGTLGSQAGFSVATPVLDDVSLLYYLPNPRVLLKERVNN